MNFRVYVNMFLKVTLLTLVSKLVFSLLVYELMFIVEQMFCMLFEKYFYSIKLNEILGKSK